MSSDPKPTKRIAVKPDDDSEAADTDRAVIITNRPMLKTPATELPSSDANSAAPGETPATITDKLKKPPKPLVQPTSQGTDDPSAERGQANDSQPAAPTAKTGSVIESNETDKPPATPRGNADNGTIGTPGVEANESDEAQAAGPTEQELNAEAEAKTKHDEIIQKLVDSKQYFLPINAVEKRKSRNFVILGVVLSLLLAMAWADIALDAGLVQIPGVKPVTHFFSN